MTDNGCQSFLSTKYCEEESETKNLTKWVKE